MPTGPQASPDLSPQETVAILHRILEAVEDDKRWAEIVCAIVLALATMASAWCVNQANL